MAAVAIAIFVFTWFFRFNDPNGGFAGLTDDHFYYLLRGWQILYGELPFRDFVDAGAPLYFYVSAAVQLLFGRGTLSELAFSTTLIALGSALTFWLAARASGSIWLGRARRAVPDPAAAALLQLPEDSRLHGRDPVALVVRRPPGRRPIIWLAVDHGRRLSVAPRPRRVRGARHRGNAAAGLACAVARAASPRASLWRHCRWPWWRRTWSSSS